MADLRIAQFQIHSHLLSCQSFAFVKVLTASVHHCYAFWYIFTFSKNSVEVQIGGVPGIPLRVRPVELVPDQLAVDLDSQIAGEGNSEEKPQPDVEEVEKPSRVPLLPDESLNHWMSQDSIYCGFSYRALPPNLPSYLEQIL